MEVWALVVILIIPAIVILTPLILRSWERRRILDAVMAASNAGQPVPAPVIEALIAGTRSKQIPPPRHERDFRRGIFLMAVGGAFFSAGLVLGFILLAAGVEDPVAPGLALGGVGLFPGWSERPMCCWPSKRDRAADRASRSAWPPREMGRMIACSPGLRRAAIAPRSASSRDARCPPCAR